jgi:hypothetical protein
LGQRDSGFPGYGAYEVTSIEVRFEEVGNRWFSKKHLKTKKSD